MTPLENATQSNFRTISNTINTINVTEQTNTAALIGYTLVAAIGLPGNTLILLVYGSLTTQITSSQLILFSIAVCDLLGCLNLPLRYHTFYNKWLGSFWCNLGVFTCATLPSFELTLLSLAAFERFRAVQNVNNVEYGNRSRGRRKILGLIFTCFLSAVVLAVIFRILVMINDKAENTFCSSESDISIAAASSIENKLIVSTFIFLNLIFIVVMYMKIALLLHRRIGLDPYAPPSPQLQDQSNPRPSELNLQMQPGDQSHTHLAEPTQSGADIKSLSQLQGRSNLCNVDHTQAETDKSVQAEKEQDKRQDSSPTNTTVDRDEWWEVVLKEIREMSDDDNTTDVERNAASYNLNIPKIVINQSVARECITGDQSQARKIMTDQSQAMKIMTDQSNTGHSSTIQSNARIDMICQSMDPDQRLPSVSDTDTMQQLPGVVIADTDVEIARSPPMISIISRQLPGVVIADTDVEIARSPPTISIISRDPSLDTDIALPTVPSQDITEPVPYWRQNNRWLLRKVTIMLFIVTSVCILAFSLSPLSRVFWPEAYLVFQELFTINYAINPFIYSVVNECFREECMVFFRKVYNYIRNKIEELRSG